MNVYEVICKPVGDTEPGAFAGIDFGPDGYSEFVDHQGDNEVWAIYTERDIDRQLDSSEGVVSYTLTDEYGN